MQLNGYWQAATAGWYQPCTLHMVTHLCLLLVPLARLWLALDPVVLVASAAAATDLAAVALKACR
jgi:hypothetical protein